MFEGAQERDIHYNYNPFDEEDGSAGLPFDEEDGSAGLYTMEQCATDLENYDYEAHEEPCAICFESKFELQGKIKFVRANLPRPHPNKYHAFANHSPH